MNNYNYMFIFLVIPILLFVFKFINSNYETFDNEHLFGRHIHVKVDKRGKIVYESYQSPSQNGELGCTQVPCPSHIDQNKTCWCCCNFH